MACNGHPRGGLGLFGGEVRRFSGTAVGDNGLPLKIPHMGWNNVIQTRPHPLWRGIDQGQRFYFVHSYRYAEANADCVVGTCDYGTPFAAALSIPNVFAVQFHPELKSRPFQPHPLFVSFVNASLNQSRLL